MRPDQRPGFYLSAEPCVAHSCCWRLEVGCGAYGGEIDLWRKGLVEVGKGRRGKGERGKSGREERRESTVFRSDFWRQM